MERKNQRQITRRRFLLRSVITGSSLIAADVFSKSGLAQGKAPAIATSDKMRPQLPYGVASGDITLGSAMIWSRCDRAAKMLVEYDTNESFRNVKRIIGSSALEPSDYKARSHLTNLPPGQQIFYRVTFQDLADTNIYLKGFSSLVR